MNCAFERFSEKEHTDTETHVHPEEGEKRKISAAK